MNFKASTKSVNFKMPTIKTISNTIIDQQFTQSYDEIDYNADIKNETNNIIDDNIEILDIIKESQNIINSNNYPYQSINYSKIKDDGFVSQSLVRINDKTFITAYTNNNLNSRIYVYDKNGNYEGILELDNSAHVGGISYDKENQILYVTNDHGKIDAYNYNKITETFNNSEYNTFLDESYKITCEINVSNIITGMKASTIYFDRGNLYVAHFKNSEKAPLITLKPHFNFDENGNKTLTYNMEEIKIQDNLPKQIQGIATTNYNGKEYLVVSCSVGFINNSLAPESRLRLYEYDETINEYKGLGYIDIDKMSEGINIDNNGNVSVIFEKEIMETYETNMEYLINNVSYDKDEDDLLHDAIATTSGWWNDIF